MNTENVTNNKVNNNIDCTVEITLLDLLIIVAKSLKTIILVPLLIAICTAIFSIFIPNIYTAKAMLLPGSDDNSGLMGAMMAQLGGLASMAGGSFGSGTKADLYVTMLKSDVIKDPIIDKYKLMDLYKIKYRTHAYKLLNDISTFATGKKDGVITITVSNENPSLSADIANSYVEELSRLATNLSMTSASQNRAFIESRLSKAKIDLAAAEDSLKYFQYNNKAVSVPDQVKATLEGLSQLRAQLIAQEVQLAALRRQFTDASQEVKSVKSLIENLRSQIDKIEGNGSGGSLPGVSIMPRLGQEYVRLIREFKVQETLVELLTKQYEMNKLYETKNVSPLQVIQYAKTPELKSKPKRSLLVIVSAICSFVLVVIIVIIRELIRRMNENEKQKWQSLWSVLPNLKFLKNRLTSRF